MNVRTPISPITGTRCAALVAICSKRGQSAGSSLPLKSAGIASMRVRAGGEGGRVALVATHQQTVDLLTEIDEQVGIAQRRQWALPAFQKRFGHDVLVRHRYQWDAHARQPADLGGEHAAAVDDDLAGDPPPVASRLQTPGRRCCSIASTRVAVCTATPRAPRPGNEGVTQLGRIEVAVGFQVGRADDSRRCRAAGRARRPRTPRSRATAGHTCVPS